MKHSLIATSIVLASTLGSFAGSSGSTSTITTTTTTTTTSSDCWAFELNPYIWAASLDAQTNLPWNGPGGPSSVQRLDTKITGAFMLEALARYNSVGLLVDVNWLQLDTATRRSGILYSGANLQTDYLYSTAALTYSLPLEGAFHADLLAGARLWHIAADYTLKPGVLAGLHGSNSQTWVSPLAGARLSYDLTKQWQLFAQGTAGGFSGNNSQWDVIGGVGYLFNDWCMATIGYRYLSENYQHNDFTFDANAHGVEVGLSFKF